MEGPLDILSKYDNGNRDFISGVLTLVNKPYGWTSFDVVNKIRYSLKHALAQKKIKVGHAGTLDPLAEGLLLICTGRYTKKLEELSSQKKSYLATIKLGATTPSYDKESEEENHTDISMISPTSLLPLEEVFLGEQEQIPPIYSAIKVDGNKAYRLARRGQDITIKSRKINITKFKITDISLPFLTIEVEVSKGTYIRSLAHDIGQFLSVGAYLTALNRTSIDHFLLQDAWEVDALVNHIHQYYNIKNNSLLN